MEEMRGSPHRKLKKRRRAMMPLGSPQLKVRPNPLLTKSLPMMLLVRMLRKPRHQSKITEGGSRC